MPGKLRDQKINFPIAKNDIDKDLKLPVYVVSIDVNIIYHRCFKIQTIIIITLG